MESEGLAEKNRAVVDRKTNRSAKDGTRSSLHYGGEGALIHPSYQGVCGRHGTEDPCVTPGELVVFLDGNRISNPISGKAKWEAKHGQWSDSRIVPEVQ